MWENLRRLKAGKIKKRFWLRPEAFFNFYDVLQPLLKERLIGRHF